MAFKLDRLSAFFPLVKADRSATKDFITLWEKLCRKLEEVIALIQRALVGQSAQLVLITQALEAAGIAIQTANAAQAAADGGGSATARSGSATNPSVTLGPLNTWIDGPTVNLLTVSAGDLTIPGSGPQQDADVVIQEGTTFAGQYRVLEVIGGVTTATFGPWDFSAIASGSPDGFGNYPAAISNPDASTVAAFLFARSSTGSVDYKIQARWTGGLAPLQDLQLYIFARRS